MPQRAVYRRAVERAAQICGGADALAARLSVSAAQVKLWIEGVEPCPGDVFLGVVDLLVDSDLSAIRPAHPSKGDGKPTS